MFDFRVPYRSESKGDETLEAHESFGLVGIHRITGKIHLFGSAIEHHGTFFRLSIKQGEVRHAHGQDWYYGRKELISIDLSAAQFAELITTLNVGDGVPCTIDRVLGTRMEPVPTGLGTETQKIQSEFKGRIKDLVGFLKTKTSETKALLEKKSALSKADKEAILGVMEKTLQEIHLNAPFFVEQFVEATEKVKTTAKAEVEAFISLSLTRMGLDVAKNRMLSTGDEAPSERRLPPGFFPPTDSGET